MSGPGAYYFGEEERSEALDVLSTGHLSRFGDLDDPLFRHKVMDFEREFASYCGVPFALATNSGTSSLLIAMHALGISRGDEILVPGFTYVATYAAIIHAGGTPVLVEVDDSLTIDPVDLDSKVTSRSKAIIAVHMLGNPCDMDALIAVAGRHGLAIIEDACQAAGASFRGRRVGSFGQFGAFSLNRYKMMSAGEGGILTAATDELHQIAFALHDQGHRPFGGSKKQAESGFVGFNLKMNELTGAVALAQLRKLEQMLGTLREKKRRLRELIPEMAGVELRRVNDSTGECATFLTCIFEDPARASDVAAALGTSTLYETGWHNYNLMGHLNGREFPACHWYEKARFAAPGALPRTDDYLSRSVSISIGVVDNGLGASFGLNIRSTQEEITFVASRFVEAVRTA